MKMILWNINIFGTPDKKYIENDVCSVELKTK